MKKILFALSLSVLAPQLYAQSTDNASTFTTTDIQPKQRANEIGLFGQAVATGGYNSALSIAGVQYKKWLRPNTGIRAILAHGNYYSSLHTPTNISISGDTIINENLRTRVNMVFLGGGIEAQRHFYKRVYLFAGLELKGGYGSGYTDTLYEKQYKESGHSTYTKDILDIRSGTPNVNMTYLGFSPSIGAKLQWNRLVIGAEIFPAEMSVTFTNTSGLQTSSSDFNMGDLKQRIFIHYRF
jgi:hypothetical protein